MPSIRDSLVALDANQYLFAVRRDPDYPNCETLVFDRIHLLGVFLPNEIQAEVRRNLSDSEFRGILEALRRARSLLVDYELPAIEQLESWQARGAKKGDAVIAATLERAGVRLFISENRHFLREMIDLPFDVVTSEQAVALLDATR